MQKHLFALAISFVATLFASQNIAADTFTVVPVGAPGVRVNARSINDSGQVTGFALFPGPDGFLTTRAFRFSDGITQRLGGPNVQASFGWGINNAGNVVGSLLNGVATGFHPFQAPGSTTQVLEALAQVNSEALGINDANQITGKMVVPAGFERAFISDASGTVVQDLGTLGGNESFGTAINNFGQATGGAQLRNANYHAFRFNGSGPLQDLGTLGGRRSQGYAINDSGQVAGWSDITRGSSTFHAFVSAPDGTSLLDLGTLGGPISVAWGINNLGHVVGYSSINGTPEFGDYHAFLYDGSKMLDLNSLLPANSGWVLNAAYDINNVGQIIGTGYFNGTPGSFLLTPTQTPQPVPEPATMILLGTGLAGIGGMVRRKRKVKIN